MQECTENMEKYKLATSKARGASTWTFCLVIYISSGKTVLVNLKEATA